MLSFNTECPRTDESVWFQVSDFKMAPFKIICRPITEIKSLLRITSQTSDSTIAAGTHQALTNVDTYSGHNTISISHLKLCKSLSAAAISQMHSLLLF